MPTRNRVPLNVRVTPTKNDEWKTAVNDDEHFPEIVRSAVDKGLDDEYAHVDAAERLDNGKDIDSTEETTDLDSLSGQVEFLQNEVGDALTPGSMPPEDQLREETMQVLAPIPRYGDGSDRGSTDREVARAFARTSSSFAAGTSWVIER